MIMGKASVVTEATMLSSRRELPFYLFFYGRHTALWNRSYLDVEGYQATGEKVKN